MERNDRLRAAREATPSPRVPSAAMSRSELADAVNAWLVTHTDRHGVLDEHYVARLERGKIRWPNSDYRAGFAAVLGRNEVELGFRPSSANRRPVRPLSEPVGIDNGEYRDGPVEVIAIGAMSRAFQAADRQVGGGVLYGQVVRYLNTEIGPRLLDADGINGPALFTAASSVTEIAGWMAHDCGQDHRARQHFDRAYRLALAAGNDASAGNVCASMSHLAGQLDRSADAVCIAEAGLVRARAVPGTVHLVARLHTMRARGLAMRGDAAGCRAALRQAERTLETARNEPSADWIAEFDAGSLASEAALCLRQLGDLPEAERQAHRVIMLRPGDRVRSRTFGQLTLARVLVDARRIDEAAAVGQRVCQVAPSLTSHRVLAQLDRLGAAIGSHHQLPEVSAFLAALPVVRRDKTHGGETWPV
ncbi:MAG: hypothetical protein ACRDS0_06360 [Pseudonocardiaceae bacterium]